MHYINQSLLHLATCTMRRLQQLDGVVAEQPPTGVSPSNEFEETELAGKRLRSTGAGSSASSTEVRNENEEQTQPWRTLIHE